MSENRDEKKDEERRERMTNTPVPRLITELAVPTIISMLVTAIYNSADKYFVGRISTEASAAVGIAFPMMAIVQALGFFYGHGSGNFLARMMGAGKHKEASEMASTGFALALLTGTAVALLGNGFIKPLAFLLGATPGSLQDTMDYMRIILIGAPFMAGQFVINNQLRFQGNAVVAMVGLMCGAVMNVGLDPLLILVFKMGVSGAAIATIAGQITSFCILLLGSMKKGSIRVNPRNVRINGYYLLQIINGGSPSLFRQGLAAISSMLLNHAAGDLGGDAAIAAMSVATTVSMTLGSALIGFGQGYQPVCSYNYGAGLTGRVKEGYWFCVKWGTLFLTIVGTACFIFAPQIVLFFRDDPAVAAVGQVALRCQAVVMPLSAPIVMGNMMLQSIGKGVKASITASARNGIFFIPLILVLPLFLGITGVEITQAVADVMTLSITLPLTFSELKKM
ncbi:MAG: MATE family efflux transporter [Lachnospiraceae bacterium]|nr:MATE family efflux transporter [Lachnospiraceae bacterium]